MKAAEIAFGVGVPDDSGEQLMAENAKPNIKLEKKPNSFYYREDGGFNEEAGRTAFAELFQYHNYSLALPVMTAAANTSLVDDKLWIIDFALADFANVGMAGIIFANDKEYGYFSHEIYLLPFQMIPEHFHLEAEGEAPKHEVWQVRHGDIWTFAKGGSEADLAKYPPDIAEALQSQLKARAVTCFNGKRLATGEMNNLSTLTESHFMIAGPEGAIVSEYGSFHSFDGLGFTNPKAKTSNTPPH